MQKSPYANKVVVPNPVIDLCSKNLLVMEFLPGKKLADSIEEKLARLLGGDVQVARKVLKAKQRTLFESKDGTSNKGFMQELREIIGENDVSLGIAGTIYKSLQLVSMTRDARKKLSLLLDATGHQIFHDGIYNGDPHPGKRAGFGHIFIPIPTPNLIPTGCAFSTGNILVLDCGRLGLIDYGQTRRLTKHDRLALAGVVAAVGKQQRNPTEISTAMRNLGFDTKLGNDVNLANFAALYFDSDSIGRKLGFPTPQKWLMHLNSVDPMSEVPDPAVFVARTSFLFRGLGALLQQQIHTSQHWRKHAVLALASSGKGAQLYNLGLTPIPSED